MPKTPPAEERKALTPREALDQAAEYGHFLAPVPIEVDTGEVFYIVEPRRFDDEQQERWEQLQFDVSQCDHEPDLEIPAHKLDTEKGEVFVPASVVKGSPLMPYRRTLADGTVQKLAPSYNERLAVVMWGEEAAKRYKDGGGQFIQIGHEWRRLNDELQNRAASDPKSH